MNTKQVLAFLCFLLSALASHADEAFRLHRYDTFKVQPINEQSIVFVGNSITNMHPWVEAFGNDPRVVNRGNSGGTSSEILANVRSYCAGHPAKIFLMIGINDKPNSSNQATIVSNIEQTILTILTESPATKIYVQSILPSGWFSNPTDIANCNSAIQTMLTRYPKVQYLDVYSLLLGKLNTDNTGVYSFDKLHTTAAGYAIWTDFIKSHVGLTPVYPSETLTKGRQLNGGNSGSFGARATYFSMMPIASSDVLFFGDEMVHGAEWQELLRNPSVKNRGTNWGYEGTTAGMPYTSNDIDATFASVSGVTKQAPKQVLLYTGTGEINAGTAVNTVLNSYKALVSKIRGYAPNAKISLVSLMPTRTYNNNARVKEFNAALQSYAASATNVEYIDIYSTLSTNDQPKTEYFPVSDNNYIYGDGYVAIANVLARYIDGCNPVTPSEAAAYRNLVKDPTAEPEAFTIFATPSSGGVPYRIPAVATAQNGNLITVADYRTSRADIGKGEVDLHIRISRDNGATWQTIMRPSVMDGDGNIYVRGYQYGAFGDPCIVADRESGRVMIMSCSGYPGYFDGSRSQHQGLARWYSYDNGETWTEAPSFLDETFIYSKLDKSVYGPITGMFIGSGKIHQSRCVKVNDYYRLYCAFSCHKAGVRSSTNFVIYSDDFGETWEFLGGINDPAVPTDGDEPKVEELPDGNLLFSGRRYNQGGRNINIFKFTNREKAEGQWMGVAVSNSYNGGILGDNATNGEILLVPVVRKSDGAKMYLALQSMPWGPNRYNVGIQYKALDEPADYDTPAHFAQNWEGSHQVSYTSSCYSTMSVQADHTIAFVYEENSKNSGYDIQYKRYTIECITNGKYSYDVNYFVRGDADGNTLLERADVGALVDYLLVRRTNPPTACDVNEDSRISISDLACLIEQLLSKL